MKQLRTLAIVSLLLLNFPGCQNTTPPMVSEKSTSPEITATIVKQDKSGSIADTPEATLRAFIIAVTTGDKDSIEQHSLPHADLEILSITEPVSDNQVELMVEMLTKTLLKSYSVGDSFYTPTGRKVEVTDTMVNENAKLLTFIGNPLPVAVRRDDNGWKVDPSSIIRVRKSAAELRRKANNQE